MLPPVILLGRGATLLGAARNLARQGIDTFWSTARDDFVAYSRYYRPAETTGGRPLGGSWDSASYDLLADMPFDRAVLLSCSDITADWIARLPGELRTRFPSCNPSIDALDTIQNKREFALLCRRLEIPHPKCFLPNDTSNILDGLTDGSTNWFLKPFNSRRFMELYGKKAVRVQNRREAESFLSTFEADGVDVLLQEYVSGGADQHYFIDGFRDRNGVVRGAMARRRRRIYPVDFGDSSYCHQVPLNEVEPAWQSLQKILKATNYRGIFSGEFKYDSTINTFKIIEVNARAWAFVEFAAWCGLDVCKLAYLDALEMDVPDVTPHRNNAGCVSWYADFNSVRKGSWSGRPSIATLIRQWFTARKTLFCWDDPRPFVVWVWRSLTSAK